MDLKNIKAVFFDAADTLFYIKEGLGNTYAKPAIKYGVNPSPNKIKKAFSKYFREASPLAFGNVSNDERKSLEKEWWYDVVKNVYTDIGMFPDFDKYFNDLFEIFRGKAWKIFPETIDVLNYLKNKNYVLIVVSNFDSRVYDVCKRLGIYNYFTNFIISSEAGHAKPDEQIFHLALKENNLKPNQCVHVGDNFVNDYECPISIGINAIYLDRNDQERHQDANKISNLNELINLI